MPATYSHRRTYEQITGRGSNVRRKPEPTKPVKRHIFGYEVDTATFKKYNHYDYDLGDCVFRDLSGVELWATSTELADHYPDTAAAARRIMEEIIAEITGKDMKTMNTPRTAADFIDALNDIYTESRNAYAILQDKVDKAAAKMEQAREELRDPSCKDQQMAQLRFDIAQGEYRVAESIRRSEYRDMMNGHEKKVAELRTQLTAYLDEHYSASPDKLDAATMQLLNSGICTPSELARLLDRHQDNPTMLRIVGSYARNMREEKRRTMSAENLAICSKVANTALANKDGSRELTAFDNAVTTAAYGLGQDYAHASRMHEHVPGWLEGFKNQIAAFPVNSDDGSSLDKE